MSTGHQYHRAFDPAGDDSLARIARQIREGSTVLDVGCGPGVLAGYLSRGRACIVDGIEGDAASAAAGADAFRSIWVADLDAADLGALCGEARYDVVVCADVLEHLRDPARVLAQARALLAPNGRIVISVPNVGNAGLIAELLGGEFRYRTEGLLDRTHLRFFTRASLLRLLEEVGLHTSHIETVDLPLASSEFAPEALAALPAPVRQFLGALPDGGVYQFIVAAKPAASLAGVTPPVAANPPDEPVDVIVPVYRGLEDTRRCIESVLDAPVGVRFELIVIEDASPEPELRLWLREAAALGRFTLLANDANLGFVATVNRGIGIHPERDVVVLNSDTEVANDWLDRLRRAAYAAPDIGTVTPFSNNATIFSYPIFCAENPLPDGWTTADLDDLARRTHPGAGVDVPTAVGFCMYLRRDCLDSVGLLDAEAFGRGYGEENDFCMRAHYRGWRHRLAADVFVRHVGGVSFGAVKRAHAEAAAWAVRERHPAYDLMVAEHIRQDPARELRQALDWQRLAASPRPRLLFVSHDLGGGVERHLRELAAWLEPQAEVLVLRPAGAHKATLGWQRRGEAATLVFDTADGYPTLLETLRRLQVARIHVQHLLGIEPLARRLVADLRRPYDFTVHDYYPVCPRVTLIDSAGAFCDQPPAEPCTRCLAADPTAAERDITAWHALQGRWLAGAARILAPSRDTAERLRRTYPQLEVRVAPHDRLHHLGDLPAPQPRAWRDGEPFRVVVLGQLSPAKGLDLLAACARDAAARGLVLEFHLLGHPLGPVPGLAEAPLYVHGPYADADLPALLGRIAPHLAWFPARWPETYSYTLSACLEAGLPVAATDLGAFRERLADRAWSWLLPVEAGAGQVNDSLCAIAREHFAPGSPPAVPNPRLPEPGRPFDYADYLAAVAAPALLHEAFQPDLLDLLARAAAQVSAFDPPQTSGEILRDRLVRLEDRVVALEGGVAERDAEIRKRLDDAGRLWGEVAEGRAGQAALRTQLRQREEELRDRDSMLDMVRNSLSWRLTRPMRVAARLLRSGLASLRTTAVSAWHDLPLSPERRLGIKSVVFRAAAPLIRHTAVYQAWQRQLSTPRVEPPPAPAVPQKPKPEGLPIPGGIAAAPRVSVVIPVYNKVEYTIACLDSIARHPPAVPIEVLVVDDGSTDTTEQKLSARDDLRYLRNRENLGFVGSCNRGAAEAHGEFVFFLNNDTVVTDGWLDTLVRTFETVPDAGLVGSKLIFPDGRLQEAGGIIWEDGSGWNWGKFGDPVAPEFNFLRDADYCSGAALLIRRQLFQALGGFDERYAPAYYEDTDLAFTVRARGLRVLYQPLSQVIHYEGVTAGTDLGSGVKAHQVANRERFLAKWGAALAGLGTPERGQPRLAADRRPRYRALVIDAVTPTPDRDSGSVDMFNYLRILLGLDFRVSFVPESNLAHFGRYTQALQALGVECLYHPFISSVEQVLEQRGGELDLVVLSRGPTAAPYVAAVRRLCPRARLVFHTVDLHYLREERRAALEDSEATRAYAAEMKRLELDVVKAADLTIVLSEVEREALAREAPGVNVQVIPLIREIPGRRGGPEGREGIVFVGSFQHPPNVDAVRYFCGEVWPLVRRALPGARFLIVGSYMPAEVAALAGDGVEALGYVEDLEALFARVRVSVAPLRYGAGLKGKVAGSLGSGVPCVATPVAIEGMALQDGSEILVAEGPAALAEALVRLYRDDALWERLSLAGLEVVERQFGLAACRILVSQALARLGLAVPADAPSVSRRGA